MIAASEEKRKTYRESLWWGDKTFYDLFLENVAKVPDRVALIDAPNRNVFAFGDQQRLSYAQMSEEVDKLASELLNAGIVKDDVIMAQLPNITELVNLYFAAASIGVIISPVAVQYRSFELSGMIKLVKPKAFICATEVKGCDHIGTVLQVLAENTKLMTFGPNPPKNAIDLSNAKVADSEKLSQYREKNPINADDIFTICWTSGTTGVPKGVPRSHNHWIAIGPATYQSAQLIDGDILLNPFPLINMASIGGVTLSWLWVCGTMVLHHPFDPQVYLAQIAIEKPNFTIAPPAILNMLLQNEALLNKCDLSSLRTIGSGASPLSPSMVKGFHDRFGITVINLFGSNEGMSLVTGAKDVPDPEERASYFPRSAKLLPPYGNAGDFHIKTRLVPPEGGEEICQEFVPGELQIKGPTLFEGYWESEVQTKAAFTEDGYYKTGDLFQIEGDGRFYRFVGRSKDLIIRGGVNIAPEEIELLLADHPKIAESCAIPLPDKVLGERIGIVIIPKPEQNIALSEITDFLRQKDIAVFKLPEKLFIIDSLPRNVTNKVIRTEVLERILILLESET